MEANSYIGEFEVASVVRRSCDGFAVALSLLVTAALVGKLVYPLKDNVVCSVCLRTRLRGATVLAQDLIGTC